MRKSLLPLLLALMLLTSCAVTQPDNPDDIIDIGGNSPAPSVLPTGSEVLPTGEDGTPAPSDEVPTDEGRILAGFIVRLNNGEPLSSDWEGERYDLDGDGVKELISVGRVDGAPTILINGAAFMDAGARVSLASFDGKNIVLLSETDGREGFFAFYPDTDGNLFCRLFAISETGSVDTLARQNSLEDYIKNGLDVMLHNPILYTSVNGDTRSLSMDMDGDGNPETVAFDSATLSVRGFTDDKIMLTTMPRFTYDADKNTLVIRGSAGDYVISLYLENGELRSEMTWAKLL